ncbi:hypothetical protein FQR65_LT02964 [Abscondita terminalis]|nr:hypothetical protein FQR65_LT02964 [Abscondita terminalis]
MIKLLTSLLILTIVLGTNCVYGARIKRCANLFDESCINDGIVGSGPDEEWMNGGGTPGKRELFSNFRKMYPQRCANLFDESCINGGLVGGSNDETWLNNPGWNPGKRSLRDRKFLNILMSKLRGHSVPGKRCANLRDESCDNEGIIGSGTDEEWLNGGGGPGRR